MSTPYRHDLHLPFVWEQVDFGNQNPVGGNREYKPPVGDSPGHLAELCDYLDLDGNLLITNDPFTGLSAENGILSSATAREQFGLCVRPKMVWPRLAGDEFRAAGFTCRTSFASHRTGCACSEKNHADIG